MGSLLSPSQPGYGTSNGSEAAVHAARTYLSNMGEDKLLLKLDFNNAFNSIRRDKMLNAVLEKAPVIYPLVHSVYSQPTYLYFGDNIIPSSEGVLFCLTILELTSNLKAEVCIFYLDDGTLGGTLEDVTSDFKFLEAASKDLGLHLNKSKCEVICAEGPIKSSIMSGFPSFLSVNPTDATILGAPIGGFPSIDLIRESKIKHLQSLGERLKILHAHDALCLLQHALVLPKVLYVLRTAPCFQSELLKTFDSAQRSILESICNITLNNTFWLQASMPINHGGLGIRSALCLPPQHFLPQLLAALLSCLHFYLPLTPSGKRLSRFGRTPLTRHPLQAGMHSSRRAGIYPLWK